MLARSSRHNVRLADTVLTEIFNCCNVEVLKIVRVVSKRWSALALKCWRAKAVLRIDDETDPEDSANYHLLYDLYLNKTSCSKLGKFPFRRLGIEDTEELQSLERKDFLTRDPFLQACWTSLNYLEAYMVDVYRLLTDLLPKMPQLQSLKLNSPLLPIPYVEELELKPKTSMHPHLKLKSLNLVDLDLVNDFSDRDISDEELEQAWKSILLVCINLKIIRLEFATDGEAKNRHVLGLLRGIGSVKKEEKGGVHAHGSPLRALNVCVDGMGMDSAQYTSAMVESGLEARRISIEGDLEKEPTEAISRLFQLSRKSLTELTDYRHPSGWHFQALDPICKHPWNGDVQSSKANPSVIQLPALRRYCSRTGSLFCAMYALALLKADLLESVTISLDLCDMYGSVVEASEERAAAIKGACSLDNVYVTHSIMFGRLMKSLLLPNVTAFAYENLQITLGPTSTKLLAKSMPNLKQLEMSFTPVTIATIWGDEAWPNLESISISAVPLNGHLWTDDAIVGLQNRNAAGVLCRRGIQNLEKLRTLCFVARNTNTMFTDISAREGFLKLPMLTSLQFPFTKLSSECLLELQKQIRILRD